uniref:Uncharacterized protein n=1 Tax=Timema genevievae TaxID=629358 RepID=A0A7R9PGB8_TIMGE|nr:unnamed protein product [Timema genevievae]
MKAKKQLAVSCVVQRAARPPNQGHRRAQELRAHTRIIRATSPRAQQRATRSCAPGCFSPTCCSYRASHVFREGGRRGSVGWDFIARLDQWSSPAPLTATNGWFLSLLRGMSNCEGGGEINPMPRQLGGRLLLDTLRAVADSPVDVASVMGVIARLAEDTGTH